MRRNLSTTKGKQTEKTPPSIRKTENLGKSFNISPKNKSSTPKTKIPNPEQKGHEMLLEETSQTQVRMIRQIEILTRENKKLTLQLETLKSQQQEDSSEYQESEPERYLLVLQLIGFLRVRVAPYG